MIEELKEYHEMLNWRAEYPPYLTEKEAKKLLKEDLEFIIGTNGEAELFSRELELCKLVGIKLERTE